MPYRLIRASLLTQAGDSLVHMAQAAFPDLQIACARCWLRMRPADAPVIIVQPRTECPYELLSTAGTLLAISPPESAVVHTGHSLADSKPECYSKVGDVAKKCIQASSRQRVIWRVKLSLDFATPEIY
jgi:hypothetical protein